MGSEDLTANLRLSTLIGTSVGALAKRRTMLSGMGASVSWSARGSQNVEAPRIEVRCSGVYAGLRCELEIVAVRGNGYGNTGFSPLPRF